MDDDTTYLVAIVELEKADRVLCQAPSCNHPIFRRVHIVLRGIEFQLLGSTCFSRLYGDLALAQRTPQFGGAAGVPMTPENRQLLLQNTAEFVAHLQAQELDRARLQRLDLRTPEVAPDAENVTPGQDHQAASRDAKSGRDLLAYMWRRKGRAAGVAAPTHPQLDALSRLMLRYYETGQFGDPWALAQIMLGRHRISHLETLAVLTRLDLVELLPAYSRNQRDR